MANLFGRKAVALLTNKSGGAVIKGDVVILDTANDTAFTTTTTAAYTGAIGVADESIASNATGRVVISGYVELINVNASVTRGYYGKTHTVAKQATSAGSSRVSGSFCQFVTGGTTPSALIWQPDLGGASLSDPMTTRGDVIYRNSSNVTARLGVGTAGQALQTDGTDVSWGAVGILQSASATRTAGDVTTTSTSFTDLTGATVTLTTGARRCLVLFQCVANNSGAGNNTAFDIAVDGTLQGQTYGLALMAGTSNATITIPFLTAVLSAASHTIKIQWRVDAGTGKVFASTTVAPYRLIVLETGLTV